jgi:hypothetical protein
MYSSICSKECLRCECEICGFLIIMLYIYAITNFKHFLIEKKPLLLHSESRDFDERNGKQKCYNE